MFHGQAIGSQIFVQSDLANLLCLPSPELTGRLVCQAGEQTQTLRQLEIGIKIALSSKRKIFGTILQYMVALSSAVNNTSCPSSLLY